MNFFEAKNPRVGKKNVKLINYGNLQQIIGFFPSCLFQSVTSPPPTSESSNNFYKPPDNKSEPSSTPWGSTPTTVAANWNQAYQPAAGYPQQFGAAAVATPAAFGDQFGALNRTVRPNYPTAATGSAFVGLNGSSGPSYNLAVNAVDPKTMYGGGGGGQTAIAPTPGATSLAGNLQPGYQPRPSVVSSHSSNNPTERYSGTQRTDQLSPDTTTKDFINPQQTFLAYSAGEVPPTGRQPLSGTASAPQFVPPMFAPPQKPPDPQPKKPLQESNRISSSKEDDLIEKLRKNVLPEAPPCDCFDENSSKFFDV